jgi:hypothetical protein
MFLDSRFIHVEMNAESAAASGRSFEEIDQSSGWAYFACRRRSTTFVWVAAVVAAVTVIGVRHSSKRPPQSAD